MARICQSDDRRGRRMLQMKRWRRIIFNVLTIASLVLCIPAAVLWVLSVGGTPWAVRAATGTALILGYAAVLVRIRQRVLDEPDLPSPVLARLAGPISLGTGSLLLYLPLAAYWPGTLPTPAQVGVLVLLGLVGTPGGAATGGRCGRGRGRTRHRDNRRRRRLRRHRR